MTFPYQQITDKIYRPIIPLVIKSGDKFIFHSALIDSGADYCIFDLEVAKHLKIKLKRKVYFRGIGKGDKMGYWSDVDIQVGRYTYSTKVVFTDLGDFGHAILGSMGFFDFFEVKLSFNKKSVEVTRSFNN